MEADHVSRDPELDLIAPFLPEGSRQATLDLHALLAEIRHGLFSVNDESLARVKLAWWRDEIERMLMHRADHPAARALAESGDIDRLDTGELGDLLEGLLMRLEGRLYNDDDEMLLHCWRNEAVLAVTGARLAGADSRSALNAARDFGLARALARLVLNFDNERQAGRCWIPLPRLQLAGLSPEGLFAQPPDTSQRIRLLAPLADMAEARLASADRAAPGGRERQGLRAAVLLAGLSTQALTGARKADFRPWEPGPLRRLFTIWRAARGEARAARD